MCETIIIGGYLIESVADAKSKLGDDNLVWDEDVPPSLSGENCLCWLDMGKTAERLGYVADNQHGGDPFEWHFQKAPTK